MPIYLFQHPETEEIKEVILRMTEEHVYVDEAGISWKRIFTIPQGKIVIPIDPFDPKSFVDATGKKKGTLGDLFEQSESASEARKKRFGIDPVKKKALEEWSHARGGKVHPDYAKL